MEKIHRPRIVAGLEVGLQLIITIEDRFTKIYLPELTSKDPMKGEIVSGSSGAIAPMSFQFLVRPSLTEFACSADVVRLYRIAMEFAS